MYNNLRKNLRFSLNSSFIIYNPYYYRHIPKQHLNAIPELLFPKKYVPPLIKYLPGCNYIFAIIYLSYAF